MVATLAIAAITLVLIYPYVSRSSTHGGSGASTAGFTTRTIESTHGLPDLYKVDAQYPVVYGLPNASLQKTINDELSVPAEKYVSDFTTSQALNAKYASTFAETAPSVLTVDFSAYQTGKLISVKYTSFTQLSGGSGAGYGLESLTIVLATGRALTDVQDFLTPSALSTAGLTTLADDLQAQRGISECDGGDGGFGGSELVLQVLEQMVSPGGVAVLNLTAAGIEFSFQEGAMSGRACQPVGTLPLSALSGLVSPSLLSLAAAA